MVERGLHFYFYLFLNATFRTQKYSDVEEGVWQSTLQYLVANEPKDCIQDYVDALQDHLPEFEDFSHHDIKKAFHKWGWMWKAPGLCYLM